MERASTTERNGIYIINERGIVEHFSLKQHLINLGIYEEPETAFLGKTEAEKERLKLYYKILEEKINSL